VKLAHIAIITPNRCGLYETTRELVAALRKQGVDSRICDPTGKRNGEDRGALFADLDWAETADLIVNHSGLGSRVEAMSIPVLHVLHGRPRNSFLLEMGGKTPILSYHYHKNRDERWKAVVTFWPEHIPYHEVMWTDTPVHLVQPPVDLERWTPNGPNGYAWHGMGGAFNVVCTDAWRLDIDPFTAVHAFALSARKGFGWKLHIYGNSRKLGAWSPLLKRIQDDGNLGQVAGWVSGLAHVYRAADLMITPHTIHTRAVREAMACGCPVQRIASLTRADLPSVTQPRKNARQQARRDAERMFDPAVTARQFKEICDGCL
jgi:glycosyltransferase involved in cell wall biosynthesis